VARALGPHLLEAGRRPAAIERRGRPLITDAVFSIDRDHQLRNHLRAAAGTRRLLGGTDFDGTLVELHDDPAAVWLTPGAAETLTALATQPGVTVAVLSGRS